MSGHTHTVRVGAVVLDDARRVLVVRRRAASKLGMPSGILQRHEGPYDGLRRVVYGEAGVRVGAGYLTGVYKDVRAPVITLVFRCAVSDLDPPAPAAGTPDAVWLAVPDALRRTGPLDVMYVVDALRPVGAPFLRLHDDEEIVDG
jgi:ADP-ribose pyrophosphatase YjhB (NUDIX family)